MFESTLRLIVDIWQRLPIVFEQIISFLEYEIGWEDNTFTVMEILFGVGLSVILAYKIFKTLI